MQKPARIDLLKNLSDPEARRDRVEALLWKAFPARSRAAMARKAASALGCSQSTIINWTRGEGGPDLRQTAALVTILGLRAFIRILHRGRL